MTRVKKENNVATRLLFGFEDSGALDATLDVLGGKGYQLVQRHKLGLPIPKAKVLSTELCRQYKRDPQSVVSYLKNEAIPEILKSLKRKNGDMPLVSVRSGAKVSMPGMMDTILNIGLTKSTLPFWEKQLGARAARDCRRRFMQMFGDVVCGIDGAKFEDELKKIKSKRRIVEDSELNEADLSDLIVAYDKIYRAAKVVLPETIEEQVLAAAEAVMKSWDNPRAKEYRKIRGFSDDWGTAIVVQEMVFGNKDEHSCTGVLFTRNAALGTNEPMGEFLVNAQGEDVVAGIRTPDPIYKMKSWNPKAYEALMGIADSLEKDSRDVQDIEFTVQSGDVYILQTRTAQRSALAAVKIAVDMAKSGLITKAEALSRVTLSQYEQLCAPMIAPTFTAKADVVGLAASNGISTGKVVFSSDDAVASGDDCILVSEETTPDDLPGMHAAKGILTATGGVTSHAAVVARGMDKVCVVGASGMKFIKDKHGEVVSAKVGDHEVVAGDMVTLDGATGRVWVGTSVPVVPGGTLPALLDFNDMIYEVYPVYRIVTDGHELHQDFPMVYATYALDGMSPNAIRTELLDSMPYLNGILDLSTLEEHSPKEDAEVLSLGGSSKDNEVFDLKAEIALGYRVGKSNVRVYLGRRTKEYKERFERAGYDVLVPAELATKHSNGSVFSILTGDEPSAAAVWAAAKNGANKSVHAIAKAPADLLNELAARKEAGESVAPILALSVPQMLSSLRR